MIRLSTKGRYATRMLVYLATRGHGSPSPKRDIASAEGISPDYVEQILVRLRSAGLVQSHRGARGGFSLARPADEISVAEVIVATEGPIDLAPCKEEYCTRADVCATRELWNRASRALESVLAEETIATLADKARRILEDQTIQYDI